MKKCIKCKQNKLIGEFNKKKRYVDGHDNTCRVCARKGQKEHYYKNKEKLIEKSKKYNRDNKERIKEYIKQYNIDNLECLRESRRVYYDKNKERIAKYHGKRRKDNPELYRYYSNKRNADKLNATPPWADLDKIKIVYEKAKWLESITGLRYHVDHIIPLKGKNVCGLHVWANLQILEASINISKGNKYEM